MRRRLVIGTVTLVTAITLFAASVHFKGSQSFFDNGLTLTESGALAGLGNVDLQINLSASAIPTATCTNQGGNQAPGQNPATVNVTGSEAIPASAIKNGTVAFSVTTNAPAQPTAAQAGCPNDNWTANIVDLQFTSAILTVQQPVGTYVLTRTYQLSCPSYPTGIGGCIITSFQ